MLQHVTLEVRPDQVRDCVRFWELIGFTELLPPPTLRDRFTWVGLHDTHIHLVPMDEPAIADQGHYAIVADDPEAALAALREPASTPSRAATRGTRRAGSCATRPGTSSS